MMRDATLLVVLLACLGLTVVGAYQVLEAIARAAGP